MSTTKQENYEDMVEELSDLVDSMDIDVAGQYNDEPQYSGPSHCDAEWSE